MRGLRSTVLPGLLAVLALSAFAPPARAAGSLGIAKWEAGTCNGSELEVKECKYSDPTSVFYTQSAGHPPWGLTSFELASTGEEPHGSPLKRIRVDIPPGLAADPVTLPACEMSAFEANACLPGTEAGFVQLKAYVEIPLAAKDLTLEGNVYNLGQGPGLPLLFGIDVKGIAPLVENVHLLLEGHVSYAGEAGLTARGVPSGDYHEWFEIKNIPQEVPIKVGPLPLAEAGLKTLESKLFFNGRAGAGNFLTMPSNCAAPTTSYLELETYSGETSSAPTTPPVGVTGCDKVPFEPTATVTPAASESQYDTPDGAVTEVKVQQNEGSSEINTADIQDAHGTLPDGLTLNAAAAHGLEACTQKQLAKGVAEASSCPAGSKIGTVEVETDLPPHSLTGSVYLGKANGAGLITAPPYLIFIDAESVYGVSLRLEGKAVPNPENGRLEVSFLGNPQLPFSSLTLRLNGGARAPLANPDGCAAAPTGFTFTPWTGAGALSASTPFQASGCPSPIPFALSQSTQDSSAKAGADASYTFSLGRADGEQYLSALHTVLPAGLIGAIPSLTPCPEPQAQTGNCPSTSLIGTATASVGAGGEPYAFSGPVYFTGPYGKAPFGLSIPIEAAAGPFDLGRVLTRAEVGVETYSGRVTVTSSLPKIVGGVPLRLRSLSVAVNRAGFLTNPTSCGALATESTLTSTLGASALATSPFQVGSCGALAFKPNLSASGTAQTSRASGASLQVKITQHGHEANLRSVVVQLPPQLPSRLSTLQKACTQALAATGLRNCNTESLVGSATVTTPVLPGALTGPAYLVAAGGASFPNLELLLEGDGVQVILVGNTSIRAGVTTSTFATIPDVPVSSFALSLPAGPYSALAGYGNFCPRGGLRMPTTITAQNGMQIKQSTPIAVLHCGVQILGHRLRGRSLLVTLRTFAAGRVSLGGRNLRTVYRKLNKASTITIAVPLSRSGLARLSHRGRKLPIRLRAGFVPALRSNSDTTTFSTFTLRR